MNEAVQMYLELGILGSIGVVFIYILITGINIAKDWSRLKLGIKNHDIGVKQRTEISPMIKELLSQLALETQSCRAYVVEFHNGVTSLGGLPFLKMSCTYEALRNNARSEIITRENMSLLTYSDFYKSISEKDYMILDVENKSEDIGNLNYETLKTRRIYVTIRAKIIDNTEKVIGFVGIDYCKPIDKAENIRPNIKYVKDTSLKLGTLLSLNKKKFDK